MVEVNQEIIALGIEEEDETPIFPTSIMNFLTDLKDKVSKSGTKFFVDETDSIECDLEDGAVGFINTDPICYLAGVMGIAWWLHNSKLALSIDDAVEISKACDKSRAYEPALRNLILEAVGLYPEAGK